MPEPIAVVSLGAVLFAISLTPGPAAAYCVAIGMEEESASAFWAPVGVTLGKLVHLGVAAVGAAWINALPGSVRVGILAVAVAYLAWEGVRHWTHRKSRPHHGAARSGPHDFHIVLDGFLISVANPESLASSVAILPLFVGASVSGAGIALLVGAGTVAVLAAYSLYEAISVAVAKRMAEATVNRVVGGTYLVAAVGLAVIAFS